MGGRSSRSPAPAPTPAAPAPAPAPPPPPPISAELASNVTSPAPIGKVVLLTISIKNLDSRELPSGSSVLARNNAYWSSTAKAVEFKIMGATQSSVELRLEPKQNVTIYHLPPTVTLDLIKDNKVLTSHTHTFSFFDFDPVGMIKPLVPEGVPNVNILIFGWMGAGKSTMIQSFMTVLTDKAAPVRGAFQTGSMGGHSTVNLRRFKLHKDLPVTVWDTWGVTHDNYEGDLLKLILAGRIPDDWRMYDAVTEEKLTKTNLAAIDAVIVFVPVGALGSPRQVTQLKAKFAVIREAGYNPLLILSRVDEDIKDIRNDPLSDNKAFQEMQKKFAEAFMIETAFILPGTPYVEEKFRSFNIDKAIFRVLSAACQLAGEHAQFQGKKGMKEDLMEILGDRFDDVWRRLTDDGYNAQEVFGLLTPVELRNYGFGPGHIAQLRLRKLIQ